MATSGINQLNRLRLSGMASGMDTEGIITQMMKIEQMKVDKQFQTKTLYEWKRDAYRDINKQLSAFREEFMSSSNSLKNIQSSFNFKQFKVTSDDKNSAITITAGSGALTGSGKVNGVAQLAKAASVKSMGEITKPTEEKISVGDSLKDMIPKLGNSVTYVQEDDGTGTMVDKLDSNGNKLVEFKINGEKFTFSEADSLQKVINTVNANSKANVTMSYSQLTDKVTITSKTTGSDPTKSKVDISDEGGSNFLSALGLDRTDPSSYTQGQNAVLWINETRTEQTKNNFTIDGITYDLKKTFGVKADSVDPSGYTYDPAADGVTYQVSADVDKAMDVIKGFVEGYNKMVASLTALVIEKRQKAYPPLTDEQRDALSDAQQEKWDKLAKQGMLYNDSGLNKLLQDMRGLFFEKLGGTGMSLNDLGIGPGSSVVEGKYVGASQDIVIKDEDRLRKMLAENPDMVASVFMQTSSNYADKGFSGKLVQTMSTYTSKIQAVTTSTLERSIKDANDMLDNLKLRMSAKEELLYRKFSAMETALSKLQSQGNWFSSQFGS